ncbi:hypothetical protein MAR_033655 [Mya arenaria]|uniref:Uncharacterized protein n=1 Tax=Mya arenaria TaxID=6604 RepID=A0ABY7G9L4_MYAAR|nr:hypothetical protein MAR_033655 [Mya arenaria]
MINIKLNIMNVRTLDKEILQTEDFKYVDLDNIKPENRTDKRKYLQQLSKPDVVSYGGSIGTLNDRTERNLNLINEVTYVLPTYSSGAMRKEFIDMNVYAKITGCEQSFENSDSKEVDEECQNY